MDSADILVKKLFYCLKLYEETPDKLEKLATELEEYKKNKNVGKVVGSSASVGGAAALTVAGVAAVCTGGLAIPFLAIAGAVASGLGLVTNVGSEVISVVLSSNTMEEAKKISKEIENLGKEIQEHMETLSTETKARCKNVSPDDYVMERILRAIAKRNGLKLKDKDDLITLAKRHHKKDMDLNILKTLVLEQPLLSEFVTGSVTKEITKHELEKAEELEKGFIKVFESFGVKASPQATKHMTTGTIGLVFAVAELINNIKNVNNIENAGSKSLRNLAETIESTANKIKSELDDIEELCQTLANRKKCVKCSCVIL